MQKTASRKFAGIKKSPISHILPGRTVSFLCLWRDSGSYRFLLCFSLYCFLNIQIFLLLCDSNRVQLTRDRSRERHDGNAVGLEESSGHAQGTVYFLYDGGGFFVD